MRKKILIVGSFATESALILSQNTNFEVLKIPSTEFLQYDLSAIHGLIIRSGTTITQELLTKAKTLQVIVTATSGFDHIDLDAAKNWGITIMHCPDAHIESTAELTWGLVLSAIRNINILFRNVKAGDWNREAYRGLELSGKTFGIIGLGRIGQRVSEMATAFKMHVIAYDPYQDEDVFNDKNVERVSFEEVLRRSDILSLHVPKTKETVNMIGRTQFDIINHKIILINTCRGGVINELDLCEAISKGTVGFAALDVFEKEPLQRNSQLLQIPNIILTPHMGAQTSDAFLKASDAAAIKVLRFFLDGMTSDTLPPKSSWFEMTKSLA